MSELPDVSGLPVALIVLRPGDGAVYCGIYRCDCDDGHECVIEELDHRLPRFVPGCSGHNWHLVTEQPNWVHRRRQWPSGKVCETAASRQQRLHPS